MQYWNSTDLKSATHYSYQFAYGTHAYTHTYCYKAGGTAPAKSDQVNFSAYKIFELVAIWFSYIGDRPNQPKYFLKPDTHWLQASTHLVS